MHYLSVGFRILQQKCGLSSMQSFIRKIRTLWLTLLSDYSENKKNII